MILYPIVLTYIVRKLELQYVSLQCLSVPCQWRIWRTILIWQRISSMAKRRVWQKKMSIEYLSLTIGFSLSVHLPNPPPGWLRTLLWRRSFYTVRWLRSANQWSHISMLRPADQSAIAYLFAAPGRPISDRVLHRYQCSASDKWLTVCYTVKWPCVNIR